MRFKILGILIICLMFITPTFAVSGIGVSPSQIVGSGGITVSNPGDTDITVTSKVIQIMKKDGQEVFIDTNQPAPTESFTLKAGESKVINVNINVPDGALYGVEFDGMTNEEGQIKAAVCIIARVVGGQPAELNPKLDINPKYIPITLSGVPISVTYDVKNIGNVAMDFEGKTFYVGDTGKVIKEYPTSFFDFGFKDCDGNQVFVFPSGIFVLALIGGVIVILRRKVDIQLK